MQDDRRGCLSCPNGGPLRRGGGAARLDAVDLRILAALQRDGRMTKLGLAAEVHLSPTPCWERLRRLEQSGIIAGYGARIALSRLAPATIVLVEVALHRHQQDDFTRFEAAVVAEPEIVACDATGGGIDYLLRVITRDIASYQALIDRLLDADLGIERYVTYIVTKPVKAEAPLPLERLLAPAR